MQGKNTTRDSGLKSNNDNCFNSGLNITCDYDLKFTNISSDGSFLDNIKHFESLKNIPIFDPAIFLMVSFLVLIGMWYYTYHWKKKLREEREAFFKAMDGDKFNIKLPPEVDEYYEIKQKCEEAGWKPGKPSYNTPKASKGPTRILAQALMKRAISDIPLVTRIQKESSGMNKLYSQSMCSVKQWKTYQAAETLISNEVEEVRSEADEIESGWSELVWRQAMQYHNMLKNKHEMETKQRVALAEKTKLEEAERKKTRITPEELRKKKEIAAEKAANELIKMEERKKESKRAFSNSCMKKGFLEKKTKK